MLSVLSLLFMLKVEMEKRKDKATSYCDGSQARKRSDHMAEGKKSINHATQINSVARRKEHDVLGAGLEAAESEQKWKACVKNPGHKTFIPVGKLCMLHLPGRWQHWRCVEWVRDWCDLTVRLRVNHTSPARSAGDGGFYSSDGGGGGGPRVGTGYVFLVSPLGKDDSSGHGQRSWIFHVVTAKHVVFDEAEVRATLVDFYYDYVEAASDGVMKTLRGLEIVETSDDKDSCRFTCKCNDGDLAENMTNQIKLCMRFPKRYEDPFMIYNNHPVIFVSHPHGRPKHITIGHDMGPDLESGLHCYTTDTCPGSSGAVCLTVLAAGWDGWIRSMIHSQSGETNGLNERKVNKGNICGFKV